MKQDYNKAYKKMLSIAQNLKHNLTTIEECENTDKSQLPNSSIITHYLDIILIEPRPLHNTKHSKTKAQAETTHYIPPP